MSYKVRFEIEFPWTAEEAEAAEWLLARRYRLQGVTHDRLATAIREATLETVQREAMEAVAAFRKVLEKPEPRE
ncbi:MAG: hypothetical protein L0332_27070 [Chloroflexi bacterium]|nr:hypothetical protein [Chloroflexota bacterium]MCI0580260.1 hypothetical protein [Chloroflexota bacterium]MCI0649643.1 hypothetical protein [Chloroflexota bacterium]MCI0730361.1 hypothetical protein [Chloroflexota bacterium]